MRHLAIPSVDPKNVNKPDIVSYCTILEGTHKGCAVGDVVNIGLDLVRYRVPLEIPQVE